MNLSETALNLLKKRYLLRNAEGEAIEEPKGLFRRVAKTIAEAEEGYGNNASYWEKKFYNAMTRLNFLPGSPTLLNAGRTFNMLSSCFVLPIADSMRGIFKTIYDTALVQRAGGGVGYDFSRLRPKGALVKSSMGKSSGPISFLHAYDATTDTIKQGGMRKGANMAIMRVDHPDVEEFIACKRKEGTFTNFNISVAVTNEFMFSLENDEEFALRWPRDSKKAWRVVKAKDIWNKLIENAYSVGDPGIWFIDRTNAAHPIFDMPSRYQPCWIESTNPCGEQPLLPFESCNLGSINLANFVSNNEIDYEGLRKITITAVRFLDNVIDCNEYPLAEIEEVSLLNRKIGLGIMGWHDMLQQMKIPYNTQQAIDLAEKVMHFINDTAFQASVDLADERGPFPNIEGSKYDYIRNATRTTIAPTGSISMIAGCYGGIEPYFNNYYIKRVLDGEEFPMPNATLELMVPDVDWEEVIALNGSVQEARCVPEDMKPLFLTALEINWIWHLKQQAAFQKHTDNAVSKTINLPESATVSDIDKIYKTAYELGCKGVTVYRQGAKREQVLNVIKPAERPRRLPATSMKIETGCANMYVTVSQLQNELFEVFVNSGKSGGCANAYNEAVSKLITIALRSGVKPDAIIKQLRGIRCPEKIMVEGVGVVNSCPDAVGIVIQEVAASKNKFGEKGGNCPDCGEAIYFEEGCSKCTKCDWMRCG